MSSTYTKTEKDIINTLKKEVKNIRMYYNKVGNSTRALKTTCLKSALLKLGKNNGYSVYTTVVEYLDSKLYNEITEEVERDFSEWMVDLCWAKHKNGTKDWKNLESIELACEIELETSQGKKEEAILEDFLKLTVMFAKIRLFIFQYANGKDEAEKIIKKCESKCPKTGFRYLFFAFHIDLDKRSETVVKLFEK